MSWEPSASVEIIAGTLQLAEAMRARIAVAIATALGNISHMEAGMVSRHAGATRQFLAAEHVKVAGALSELELIDG